MSDITDLPGMDDLKAAGLLRKGQILGALMDHNAGDDGDGDNDDLDGDLLEDALLDASCNGEADA